MPQTNKRRRIPLFDLKVSPAGRREVSKVLASGWLTSGTETAAFERALGRLLGARHVAAVNSATSGLYLILRALGAGPGHQVVTSPFTFVATIEAIMLTGAEPALADIDPDTLTLDPVRAEEKINGKTKLLLPVDIAGLPADYQRFRQLSRQRGVPVVIDAAHSIAARFRGKSAVHFADAAVYSFYSTKNLTCGEGGAVVSNRARHIAKVRQLANHGLTSGTLSRHRARRWDYDVVDFGFKANLSDVQAAIGLGQLSRFDQDQQKREQIAERYCRQLADLTEYCQLPYCADILTHGWHLFIIRLNKRRLTIERDRFIDLLGKQGVQCGVHYRPVFSLSHYRRLLGLSPRDYPTTAEAGRSVVTLPLYPSLPLADVDYVCECVRDIVARHRR